jgi:hypothetical protein
MIRENLQTFRRGCGATPISKLLRDRDEQERSVEAHASAPVTVL